MQFGVQVWDMGAPGSGNCLESMIAVTKKAEQLGFDGVWINDHVITPSSYAKSWYPIGGAPWPLPVNADVYDPLVVMAALAANTSRITIGTSALVVPLRGALATAKSLVSIDHLSKGRVALGFAPGWWAEEFEILGIPFGKRGKILNEYLAVFTMACAGGVLEYAGEHLKFSGAGFYPGSYQRPRFPMISCGTSAPALARGARYDGLFRILTPLEDVSTFVGELHAKAIAAGNDPERVKLYDFNPIIISNSATQFEGVAELPLAGSPQRILDQLHAYEKAGMHQIVSGFTADPFGPWNEQLEKMQQFAEDVLKHFKSAG
jgi:probable F420-dependent oxidoreductase